MYFRYLTYLFLQRMIMGFLGNIFIFPIAWQFRKKVKKGFLWWWLHDNNWYGDKYFLAKHNNKKSFWTAWSWAFRNPIHNFYYSRKIEGDVTELKGKVTCHKPDLGIDWRTLKTEDKDGNYMHKFGKWVCCDKSFLGKQNIKFKINGKKYFRYSSSRPRKLWKNLYWVPEIKFGFERSNWAEQLHLFNFKRLNGDLTFSEVKLNQKAFLNTDYLKYDTVGDYLRENNIDVSE